MVEITIRENEAGQRLDKYLHKYLKDAPGSFIYKMLRKKNITLNGKKASGSELLRTDDAVKLFLADETVMKFGGVPQKEIKTAEFSDSLVQYQKAYKQFGGLKIIYESHHVLIIDKPTGMLTQKSAPGDLSLNEWLIGYLLENGDITAEELHTFKPSVCNRLDRNTSGMVVCGKTLQGSQQMSLLLKNRSLHKYYRLYVKGVLNEPSRIEGYLVKDERTNKVQISQTETEGSSYIATKYEPVKNYRDLTLLEVELITGKTHQIRAHLMSIGHPLLGDYKYGDRVFNDIYKKKYHINNQMLHAYRLQFPVMKGEFADMSELMLTAAPPEIFLTLDNEER